MRIVKLSCSFKIVVLFLLTLFLLLTGCRKTYTIGFEPNGGQSGADAEESKDPNRIKADKCYDQGDYAGALEYLQIVLNDRIQIYGVEHPNVALIINDMGESYFGLGDMENALDCFQRALAIDLAKLGVHNNTADVYTNIGRVCNAIGDYDSAIENLELAQNINQAVFGEESHEMAIIYDDIAMVYKNQGECKKSLEYFNKEIVIEQKISGDNSGEMATIYNNIAQLYDSFQMYPEALEFYEKSRFICKQVWGTDHYIWGQINSNMSNLYYSMKEYNNSIEYSKIALTVYEKQLTIYQRPLSIIYTTLALDYYYLDDMELSLQYGLKAYQTIRTYPYADAAEIQGYKDDLERIYTDSGNDPAGFEQWLVSQ